MTFGIVSAFGCLAIAVIASTYKVKALGQIFLVGFVFECISIAVAYARRPEIPFCPTCQIPLKVTGEQDNVVLARCRKCKGEFQLGDASSEAKEENQEQKKKDDRAA